MIRQRNYIKRSTKPIARESEKRKARRLSGRNAPAMAVKNQLHTTKPKRKRTAAEERAKFAREFGSKARADFVAALPSVASGHGPCVNAHVVKGDGGMGYKAGYLAIAPLTDYEHTRELHQHGPKWFQAKYEIDLEECAANTERLWQAHLAAVEPHS